MSHRFVCLQGHSYVQSEPLARTHALFCSACGLRLHPEDQLPSLPALPVPPQPLVADPTPLPQSVLVRFNTIHSQGISGEPGKPIDPKDIEEIPGYDLLGILGRGGMGIVFRAKQLSLKRQVALKMILSGRHARKEEHERFQREAEAVAKLQHPNIVQIYEVGAQHGLPYFSLEFANAGSLAQFLNSSPQEPMACAQFTRSLARAMHYAHQRGIIHRDLKPANILLHFDESRLKEEGRGTDPAVMHDLLAYTPKISDFGLAKHMEGDDRVARTNGIVGTPSYMAPEQAWGTSDVGPATDVYALGAILYEMLTGRPPFKAPTVLETAERVLHESPVRPTRVQPRIPKDLETICLTCLQKAPLARYPSAEALSEDLRRFLANEPILARHALVHDRVVKWWQRHPLLGTMFLFSMLLLVLLFWNWGQLTLQTQLELEEAQRRLAAHDRQFTASHRLLEQALASPPATEAARRELAQQLADLFRQQLAICEPDSAAAGLIYLKLGDAERTLGNRAAAYRAYRNAERTLREQVQRTDPGAEARTWFEEARRQRVQAEFAETPTGDSQ